MEGFSSQVIIINVTVYCLANVLASVVENGSTSVFLAMSVLVPAQPGIQLDLYLRGGSISKGCVCTSVLLNPCYHYVTSFEGCGTKGVGLRGALFFLHCVLLFCSVKMQWHTLRGRCHAKILRGDLSFFVWCGPQSLLQMYVATVT